MSHLRARQSLWFVVADFIFAPPPQLRRLDHRLLLDHQQLPRFRRSRLPRIHHPPHPEPTQDGRQPFEQRSLLAREVGIPRQRSRHLQQRFHVSLQLGEKQKRVRRTTLTRLVPFRQHHFRLVP